MKIKEAEEKTGLTRKAIRYYESNGLIHPAQSEENGYKDYDEETISCACSTFPFLRSANI